MKNKVFKIYNYIFDSELNLDNNEDVICANAMAYLLASHRVDMSNVHSGVCKIEQGVPFDSKLVFLLNKYKDKQSFITNEEMLEIKALKCSMGYQADYANKELITAMAFVDYNKKFLCEKNEDNIKTAYLENGYNPTPDKFEMAKDILYIYNELRKNSVFADSKKKHNLNKQSLKDEFYPEA